MPTPKRQPRKRAPRKRTPRKVENRELTVVEGTGVHGGAGGSTATRLNAEGLSALERLASLGLRQTSIAARLGISVDAYEGVMREQSEAALAFHRGRADLEAELATTLVALAKKGNVAATIFALKNLNWSDSPLHQSDPRPGPAVNIIIPPAMSEADFKRVISGEASGLPPGPPDAKPAPSQPKQVTRS